jgi:ribosome-binding protein aMBF1 (putative translation factor)
MYARPNLVEIQPLSCSQPLDPPFHWKFQSSSELPKSASDGVAVRMCDFPRNTRLLSLNHLRDSHDHVSVPKPIGADKQRRARNIDESLGAELTELRTRRGWSQQKLAELVGYDESYIRQLERGAKSATLRTLANLAAVFPMKVSLLVSRSERRLQRHRSRK